MILVLAPVLFGLSFLSGTLARASRFDVRASVNGTPLEVPDVG